MMKLMLEAALTTAAFQSPTPEDFWQECQIETTTLCTPDGCTNVEPTLKLYFGDYKGSDGRQRGYYYRCRRDADCDRIEDPWIGENEKYRAFVARERGLISRIGPGGKVTDVATLDENVLISRGSCWDAPPHRPDLPAGN
jgi:hypothetical protein